MGAYSVRGNHDYSALAAYRALQENPGADIDVSPNTHHSPVAMLPISAQCTAEGNVRYNKLLHTPIFKKLEVIYAFWCKSKDSKAR